MKQHLDISFLWLVLISVICGDGWLGGVNQIFTLFLVLPLFFVSISKNNLILIRLLENLFLFDCCCCFFYLFFIFFLCYTFGFFFFFVYWKNYQLPETGIFPMSRPRNKVLGLITVLGLILHAKRHPNSPNLVFNWRETFFCSTSDPLDSLSKLITKKMKTIYWSFFSKWENPAQFTRSRGFTDFHIWNWNKT